MIPSRTNIETIRDEREREIADDLREEEREEPYFEYEWFGLTYSYTKAGYWLRVIVGTVGLLISALAFFAIRELGLGVLALLLAIGVFGILSIQVRRFGNP